MSHLTHTVHHVVLTWYVVGGGCGSREGVGLRLSCVHLTHTIHHVVLMWYVIVGSSTNCRGSNKLDIYTVR